MQLPTGTGKTRIMALWMLGLAGGAPLPRRLVWVVDRRAVVDQATSEAERLRRALESPELQEVRGALGKLSASVESGSLPLAISTLRGAFEDNGEWSEDPSRPAIIVGTVDMVGSRMLFSGYGDGRYHRPLHAGLLGRDSLVVLDEAHLSRPFEALLRRIEELQTAAGGPLPPFHFLPLSATLGSEEAFTLLDPEREGGTLSRVLSAPKRPAWHTPPGMGLSTEVFRDKLLERAREFAGHTARVVVYLDRLKDVSAVQARLSKQFPGHVVALTGTMRGHERDLLVDHRVFSRFLSANDAGEGVAFLVSTSAGEVGVDLYADQMICDLVPADRMIQRFGRVNRAGIGEATVDIFPRSEEATHAGQSKKPGARAGKDRAARERRAVERTEEYLRALQGVSPGELAGSPPPADAFAPVPPHPPLRTWHLDAWSLTTHSGDALPVNSWLRGLEDGGLPDVYFAWREEIEALTNPALLDDDTVEQVFQEYRLLPRELLRADIRTARDQLEALGKRAPDSGIVVLSSRGALEFRGRIRDLAEGGSGIPLAFRTVVLPAKVGGLDVQGILDASVEEAATDVSSSRIPDKELGDARGARSAKPVSRADLRDHGLMKENDAGWELVLFGSGTRVEGSNREEVLRKAREVTGLRSCWAIELRPSTEDSPRRALVYLRVRPEPGGGADVHELPLSAHLDETAREMGMLTERLALPGSLAASLVAAARAHDLGKSRRVWQEYAGNTGGAEPLAKSTRYRGPAILGGYRHELGSVIDLGPVSEPLVRYLIATHHGYGRPEFPDRATDREHRAESRDERNSQLRRFTAMQREHGWWGLAYLEALLKTADARASA